MKNYYQIFNLGRKASSIKLMLKLEKVVRRELSKGKVTSDSVNAFRILSSEQLRKFYELKLSHPDSKLKGIRIIDKVEEQTDQLIQSADLVSVFSEKQFLKSNLIDIFLRSLGLDFLFSKLSYQWEKDGQTKIIGHQAQHGAFFAHTLMYYGLPIFLGLLKPFLFLTLIPVFAFKCFKEYRRVKAEHYSKKLGFKI